MHLVQGWYILSTIAFSIAIAGMVVALFVLGSILGKIIPLLTQTRQHIQELGDLSADTLNHASETMDVVEQRVSQTMRQTTLAGKAVGLQAQSFGSALAGGYFLIRILKMVRFARRR